MFRFFKEKRRVKPRRCQLQLEALEERSVPAIITLAGAGRFQDNGVASLIHTSGDNYTALNLRSAIEGANAMAGQDTILLENGTYTHNHSLGQIIVSDGSGALTIENGQGGMSAIDAMEQSRVFLNQSVLNLSGMIIKNGLAIDNGGAIINNGTLNITNCQFANNEALGGSDGAAVQGGAIYNCANRILNIQNTTFSYNTAQGGTSSILYPGSRANASGGAIFFAGGTSLLSDTILNSTFSNNMATGGAGAVLLGFGSPGGYGAGGGIFAEAGNYNLSVINATFASNIAQGGQGAMNDGGNGTGGGLYLQNGGLGNVRLVNDTIAFNHAMGGQGAGGLTTNGVGSGGGLASNALGNALATPLAKVLNTIVAKNIAGTNTDVDGVFKSLGSNLIGNDTGVTDSFNSSLGDFVGTASAPLDPGLDPLGNYGGPTQTFRLRSNSYAVDRGSNLVITGSNGLPTDQRGMARLSGGFVDIGSYELTETSHDRSYSFGQGTTLITNASNSLIAGYGNPLHKSIVVRLVPGKGPAVGTLTLKADGTFTFTPPKSYHGTTSFEFEVLVSGQSIGIFTATLNVTKTLGRLTR
jgi:hypothetical protein